METNADRIRSRNDEEWDFVRKSIQKAFNEAADRMYEEDHPLDD